MLHVACTSRTWNVESSDLTWCGRTIRSKCFFSSISSVQSSRAITDAIRGFGTLQYRYPYPQYRYPYPQYWYPYPQYWYPYLRLRRLDMMADVCSPVPPFLADGSIES